MGVDSQYLGCSDLHCAFVLHPQGLEKEEMLLDYFLWSAGSVLSLVILFVILDRIIDRYR
jgi:hypothetical protein